MVRPSVRRLILNFNNFSVPTQTNRSEVVDIRDLIDCPELSGISLYIEFMLMFMLLCVCICAVDINYSLPIKQDLEELIGTLRNVRPKMPIRKTLTSSGSFASESRGSSAARTQQDSVHTIHTIDSKTGSVIQK